MNSETKICQNCKQNFTIEPEDFDFYKKIDVPPPTWCPDCRFQRRLAWRNERGLYKRKCDAPGHNEDIISIYSPQSGFKAYDSKYWWSDEWDPMEYGKEYEFARPFFAQFGELLKVIPHLTLSNYNSVQSEYCNFVDDMKNSYLAFGCFRGENLLYCGRAQHCRDSQDLLMAVKNELCYEDTNCTDSYRLFYSMNSKNCNDSYFLYNCRNCNNCFGCANLVSKSYCVFNVPYSKEEYLKKIKEFDLGSKKSIAKLKDKFKNEIYAKVIHKYAQIVGSVNVTGDNILNSKNSKFCFDIYGTIEDCKYVFHSLDSKDMHDSLGNYKTELAYESVDTDIGQNVVGTLTVYNSQNVRYSFNCHGSSHLFGCVGLRNKEYCILNRQYPKEEYEKLVPRIAENMKSMPFKDKKSRLYNYGDYLPIEISPFPYNDTIAQEFFQLTKEEAAEKGYSWREPEVKIHSATMKSNALPDHIKDVRDDILDEVVACAHEGKCAEQCAVAFKITPRELQFYRNLNIPLPEICFNCRHYQRLKQRNPLKLWHRKCMCSGSVSSNNIYKNTILHFHAENPCPNEFETSYSPERPEIIYCEQCYNAEVA